MRPRICEDNRRCSLPPSPRAVCAHNLFIQGIIKWYLTQKSLADLRPHFRFLGKHAMVRECVLFQSYPIQSNLTPVCVQSSVRSRTFPSSKSNPKPEPNLKNRREKKHYCCCLMWLLSKRTPPDGAHLLIVYQGYSSSTTHALSSSIPACCCCSSEHGSKRTRFWYIG